MENLSATSRKLAERGSFSILRNGTEAMDPIRKEHKTCFSVSGNWLPLGLAIQV